MTTDSLIPNKPDCNGHIIRAIGSFPSTRYIARFYYNDGCVRDFDGVEWKVVCPSQAAYQAELAQAGV